MEPLEPLPGDFGAMESASKNAWASRVSAVERFWGSGSGGARRSGDGKVMRGVGAELRDPRGHPRWRIARRFRMNFETSGHLFEAKRMGTRMQAEAPAIARLGATTHCAMQLSCMIFQIALAMTRAPASEGWRLSPPMYSG